MRKLYLLLAVFVLMCALPVPALAAQADMPLYISGNTYYDSKEEAFLYYVNATASQAVRSNVADGMITEKEVSVKADNGITLEVYLNGQRLQNTLGGTFQTPGEYVVMLRKDCFPSQSYRNFATILPAMRCLGVLKLQRLLSMKKRSLLRKTMSSSRKRVNIISNIAV